MHLHKQDNYTVLHKHFQAGENLINKDFFLIRVLGPAYASLLTFEGSIQHFLSGAQLKLEQRLIEIMIATRK